VYPIRLESVMAKIHNDIKKLLAEKPMSLVEIAEALEKPEKKVYNALKKLFSDGAIDSNPKTRTYALAQK
jgi:DNA-binding IclR family transcriptional regulator